MKSTVFTGIATALITPLDENGINYEQLGKLIDWQISEGIDGIVICGTTGEASTLTDEEHRAAIAYAVERTAGRVPVIAGVGSNDIAYGLSLAKFACEAGADALLVVTPYYNKATQEGLVRSYELLADSVTKPIIIYNVPSRTGLNVEPETYARLAEHPNIVGVKEANNNISKAVETFSLVRGKLDIYSGNDDMIVPIMSMGGKGCISVISNILPAKTREICTRFFSGDVDGSAALQCELLPLMNALFWEVNPIPVKAAAAAMGLCENYLRLPLTPMSAGKYEKMLALMREQGLNV